MIGNREDLVKDIISEIQPGSGEVMCALVLAFDISMYVNFIIISSLLSINYARDARSC